MLVAIGQLDWRAASPVVPVVLAGHRSAALSGQVAGCGLSAFEDGSGEVGSVGVDGVHAEPGDGS